jgi:chemosensory pili system protein ChpA (sensor histidine kinase/response regulator)
MDEQERIAEIGTGLTPEEQALLRSFQNSVVLQPSRHIAQGNDQESGQLTQMPDQPGDPLLTVPTSPGRTPVTSEELNYIPPEMKRFFLVETAEDIHDLRRMVLDFEQRPAEQSTLSEMGRLVHKIKGAAATLGFEVLASLALIFEDVIRALQSHAIDPEALDAMGSLTGLLALVDAALAAAAEEQTFDTEPVELIEQAQTIRDALLSNITHDFTDRSSTPVLDTTEISAPSASGILSTTSDGRESREAVHPVNEIESLLRVEVGRLDKLMTHMNALVLNRASFIQMRDDILKLQSELDQALARLSSISQQVTDRHSREQLSRPPLDDRPDAAKTALPAKLASQPWDELEMERFTEFDQALRQLGEVVTDTTSASKYLRSALTRLDQIGDEQAAITHDIQRDVIQIRLVRLEDLMPRIQLEARRLANSLGKSITFTIRGQMTEIDRNISEALAEPLLQLVRNAVVHGIESQQERLEQGKLETGSIWIHAYYVGSEVVIEVGDDGRGVNPYRLAASAVAMGLLNADSARRMAFSEALDMMFMPGITTFHEAQLVAGRGIGLDEVRTAISRLKGTIQVRSELGKGSVFRIRVPISLSIVRALSVQVAGQPFAVPFSSVLQMMSVVQEDISPLSSGERWNGTGSSAIRVAERLRVRVATLQSNRLEPMPQASTPDGFLPETGDMEISYEEIPVMRLADLLGFEVAVPATQLALIVEVGRRRAALLVDQVADDQEVVVQTLPPHLRRRSIRGATVTPDGVVQLLLDLPELIQGAFDGGQMPVSMWKKPVPQTEPSDAPTVLVVDDSMSIRGALELTLTRAGFSVALARDGIEAFEKMLISVPKVMVLDIEMPRLDGFELLSVMRDTPQFEKVRVVMLTSRAAEKHREQAMKLGACAYLIKPCPQETLIETVRAQLYDQAGAS